MPSPIAHSAVGYLLYRWKGEATQKEKGWRLGRLSLVLMITLLVSNLPDLDAIPGLLFGDFGRFHNQWSHSLILGIGIAIIGAGILGWKSRQAFWVWFLLLALSYNLHVVMDFFTYDSRGVMLFWPFTAERFASPVKLFFGVRWSQGLWTASHLITLITELGFVGLLLFLERILVKGKEKGQSQPIFDDGSQ